MKADNLEKGKIFLMGVLFSAFTIVLLGAKANSSIVDRYQIVSNRGLTLVIDSTTGMVKEVANGNSKEQYGIPFPEMSTWSK